MDQDYRIFEKAGVYVKPFPEGQAKRIPFIGIGLRETVKQQATYKFELHEGDDPTLDIAYPKYRDIV